MVEREMEALRGRIVETCAHEKDGFEKMRTEIQSQLEQDPEDTALLATEKTILLCLTATQFEIDWHKAQNNIGNKFYEELRRKEQNRMTAASDAILASELSCSSSSNT